MSNIIKTYMSPVYHREPANPQGDTGESILSALPNQEGEQICLLDDLLDGGIHVPQQVVKAWLDGKQHRGLFGLLAGPPGSGKSIFALELAYRLAINENRGVSNVFDRGITSLYLSSEAEAENLIENAERLCWTKATDRIVPYTSNMNDDVLIPRVILYGRERADVGDFPNPKRYFDKALSDWHGISDGIYSTFGPGILVVDSLNVLPWDRTDILRALIDSCLSNVLLMLAVLDCNMSSEVHNYWEYFADLVFGFTYSFEKEYLVRKFRIIKARFQDHADGEHRLKINAGPDSPTRIKNQEKKINADHQVAGSTGNISSPVPHPMSPFIKEGGVFVFPSVHRYLSKTRKALPPTGYLPSPFKHLNNAIEGHGFPTSRCTALIGSRGSMKSHLAYYTMLKFLKDDQKKRALLISLRDDENAAVSTLAQIWANQIDDSGNLIDSNLQQKSPSKRIKESEIAVSKMLSEDRLEILYFWPGYVSPEEFFHLVVVSADRKPEKQKFSSVDLAVINGLEQIEARFPLCANEDMFVSGLITLLTVKGITTIVASGGHSEAGTVPAGLLPMADLILESSFRTLPSDLVNPLIGLKKPALDTEEAPHVVYEVIRGPGAREMRTRVLFYMGREADKPTDPRVVWPGSVKAVRLSEQVPFGSKV